MYICKLTLVSHQDTCPVLLTHQLNLSPLTVVRSNPGLSLLSWLHSRLIILSVVRHTSVNKHLKVRTVIAIHCFPMVEMDIIYTYFNHVPCIYSVRMFNHIELVMLKLNKVVQKLFAKETDPRPSPFCLSLWMGSELYSEVIKT